jgi:hypothetical protein
MMVTVLHSDGHLAAHEDPVHDLGHMHRHDSVQYMPASFRLSVCSPLFLLLVASPFAFRFALLASVRQSARLLCLHSTRLPLCLLTDLLSIGSSLWVLS